MLNKQIAIVMMFTTVVLAVLSSCKKENSQQLNTDIVSFAETIENLQETPTEQPEATQQLPQATLIEYNLPDGNLDEIFGDDYLENVMYFNLIFYEQPGRGREINIPEDVKAQVYEIVRAMNFHSEYDGYLLGEKHVYQVFFSDDETAYWIDIYTEGEGYTAALNNMYKSTDSDILQIIVSIAEEYCIDEINEYETHLSDGEIISMFLDRIEKAQPQVPNEIKASRNWRPTNEFYLEHYNYSNGEMDDKFYKESDYTEVEITTEQFSNLLESILMNYWLSSAYPIGVVKDKIISNSDFHIEAEYDDYNIVINADDESMIMHSEFEGKTYNIRIYLDSSAREYMELLGADEAFFTFEDLLSTEYISVFHVKERHKKNYPENGKLSEFKITNQDDIDEIIGTLSSLSIPICPYPSRENADLIFHTTEGDIYFKIKSPFTEDEEQYKWTLTEATVIAKGYYWYNCPRLYEILRRIYVD